MQDSDISYLITITDQRIPRGHMISGCWQISRKTTGSVFIGFWTLIHMCRKIFKIRWGQIKTVCKNVCTNEAKARGFMPIERAVNQMTPGSYDYANIYSQRVTYETKILRGGGQVQDSIVL